MNPWRSLRDRGDAVKLQWADLDCEGLVENGEPATITLDRRLGRIRRRSTLMHELAHIDLAAWYTADSPRAWVQKMEAIANRHTVVSLVPLDLLNDWVERMLSVEEPVTAQLAAARFDVPEDIAQDALVLLAMARERGRRGSVGTAEHPVE